MSTPKTTPASFTVPPAVARYGNIIFRDGPVHDGDVFSRKHPKMSQQNRAKLFAPFAALVGFDERVYKKEIVYVSKHELDADEEWELNHQLYKLHCLTANSRLARANMLVVVFLCLFIFIEIVAVILIEILGVPILMRLERVVLIFLFLS